MRLSKQLVVAAGVLCLGALPAFAQFEITSKDGKQTLKLGLLAQFQGQSLDNVGSGSEQDLYMRRLRILMGGKLSDELTFFLETDSPNMGLSTAGTKNAPSVYIQDAFFTYRFAQEFQIDAGMLLTANSHNSEQGATTLLPVDYGPYSFLASAPTQSVVGRDYGFEARGYLANNHFEYRAGIFQGARGTEGNNPFRYIGRVVWYPFDAETTYFYSGTYFGKKKLVAIGATVDHQDKYNSYDGDIFIDYPVFSGDAITFQGDYVQYDGGATFPTLPKQNTYLVEASYFFHSISLGPFAQYADDNLSDATKPDQKKWQVGLAYWAKGHNFNLKLGGGQVEKTGVKNRTLVQLQMQVFFF
jgi:hypothetical protein